MNFLHPCCNHKITDCVCNCKEKFRFSCANLSFFLHRRKNSRMCNKKLQTNGKNRSCEIIKFPLIVEHRQNRSVSRKLFRQLFYFLRILAELVTHRKMIAEPFLAQDGTEKRLWKGLTLRLRPFSHDNAQNHFQFTFSPSGLTNAQNLQIICSFVSNNKKEWKEKRL